ncbi:MAG: hypothetical protein RL518_2614 [Pseudomonadota bacterium]|jgi:hypothetical protein
MEFANIFLYGSSCGGERQRALYELLVKLAFDANHGGQVRQGVGQDLLTF